MDADGDEVMNEEDEGRSSGALERCSVAIIPPDTQALAQDERSKGEALKIAEIISLGSSQGSGLAANDSVQSNTSRASVPDKLEAPGDEVEPRNIAPPVHTGNNGVKEVGAGDDSWKNILTGDQGMSDTQTYNLRRCSVDFKHCRWRRCYLR